MTSPSREELEKNAEVAYQEVPTQEELLNGGKPLAAKDAKQSKTLEQKNPGSDKELDQALSDAAQDSNIGGG